MKISLKSWQSGKSAGFSYILRTAFHGQGISAALQGFIIKFFCHTVHFTIQSLFFVVIAASCDLDIALGSLPFDNILIYYVQP